MSSRKSKDFHFTIKLFQTAPVQFRPYFCQNALQHSDKIDDRVPRLIGLCFGIVDGVAR
jgi:hypothetical protein